MQALKRIARKVGVSVLAMLVTHAAIADTVTYFHNDVSGSPLAATDATGNLLWKENYKPYGEKLNQAAPSTSNKIGFHGKTFDDDTGLSYMGARYYDPVLGRFMGIDPLDFREDNLHSFNRYAYANNNPYKYVDPDGKDALEISAMFTLAVAMLVSVFVTSLTGGGSKDGGDNAGALGAGNYSGAAIDPTAQMGSGNVHNDSTESKGSGFPDRELPRDRNGNPIQDPEAEGAHTQLGQKDGRGGAYDQAREWDANGRPVKDIDFTDHGRPRNHANPHEHPYLPNPTGGTPQRGPARPLKY
jgi:RHS repeat-associated protein